MLFRREDFFAAGGWRAERSYTMDLDLWMRLLQFGEFLGLPEPLAAFRIARRDVGRRPVNRRAAFLIDEIAETDTLFGARHRTGSESSLFPDRPAARDGRGAGDPPLTAVTARRARPSGRAFAGSSGIVRARQERVDADRRQPVVIAEHLRMP